MPEKTVGLLEIKHLDFIFRFGDAYHCYKRTFFTMPFGVGYYRVSFATIQVSFINTQAKTIFCLKSKYFEAYSNWFQTLELLINSLYCEFRTCHLRHNIGLLN